jgi:hypothetical protein
LGTPKKSKVQAFERIVARRLGPAIAKEPTSKKKAIEKQKAVTAE